MEQSDPRFHVINPRGTFALDNNYIEAQSSSSPPKILSVPRSTLLIVLTCLCLPAVAQPALSTDKAWLYANV